MEHSGADSPTGDRAVSSQRAPAPQRASCACSQGPQQGVTLWPNVTSPCGSEHTCQEFLREYDVTMPSALCVYRTVDGQLEKKTVPCSFDVCGSIAVAWP